MIHIGMPLDGRHEVQPDTAWIKSLRVASGNDRLFIYRHKVQKTFVLSAWTSFPGEQERAIEIEAFDTWPEDSGVSFEYIRALCEPQYERIVENQISEKRRKDREQLEANADMIKKMAKDARNQHDEGYAVALESGAVPVHNEIRGDNYLEEVIRDVAETAGRITRILS